MQNFGLFRTGATKEKSFGSETGPTSRMTLVSWGWGVNGQEVLACPKLQYSIGIFYRMLRAPEEREVPLRPARSCVTNATLARQFAACQRQRFVDRFRRNARFCIRLLFAGRRRRVLVIFSHSGFPQSELEPVPREANSAGRAGRKEA